MDKGNIMESIDKIYGMCNPHIRYDTKEIMYE